MNLKRRVGRLEKEFNVVMEVRRMLIVSRAIIGLVEDEDSGEPVVQPEVQRGLVGCDRYFQNGWIFEYVKINGDEIPEDEIERYVQSFPIRGLPPNQQFRIAAADRRSNR
jgi:hypothetical protein